MTEKEKFFARLAKKRDGGLLSIDFFPGNTEGATEEEVYAELNRMDECTGQVDLELFPNGNVFYSKPILDRLEDQKLFLENLNGESM